MPDERETFYERRVSTAASPWAGEGTSSPMNSKIPSDLITSSLSAILARKLS